MRGAANRRGDVVKRTQLSFAFAKNWPEPRLKLINEDGETAWFLEPDSEVYAVPKDRVIIIAHPQWISRTESRRQAEWERFQSALGHLFPNRLAQRLGNIWLFHFDVTGRVREAEAAGRTGLLFDRRSHGLNTAIDRLMLDKGLLDPVRMARRQWIVRLLWVLLGVSLLLLVLGIPGKSDALAGLGVLLLLITIFGSLPFMAHNPPTLPAPERLDGKDFMPS
jgi:hypothetical protein